jgi:hypothetical protein
MEVCITCGINESMETLIVGGGLECWYCLKKYEEESYRKRKQEYEKRIHTPIICDHTIPKPFLGLHSCHIPKDKIYGSIDNRIWYEAL